MNRQPAFTFTRRQRMKALPHYAYVAFGTGDLVLYVGQTGNPQSRLNSHRRSSEWWEAMRRVDFYLCADRAESLDLERQLISELKPLHNVNGNWYPVVAAAARRARFAEVEWKP